MTASMRGCVFDTEHNGVWFHMEKTLNIYTPGHVSLVKLLVLDDSPSYTPKALFLTPSLLILGFSPSILHEILNLLDPVPLSSLSHLFLWSSWILFVYGVDPQVNFLFLLQVSIVKHSHSAPPPPILFSKDHRSIIQRFYWYLFLIKSLDVLNQSYDAYSQKCCTVLQSCCPIQI